MREVKTFEVRDSGTLMPVLAIHVSGQGDAIIRRGGYGDWPMVLLISLNGSHPQVQHDPYAWTGARTLHVAHLHIQDNWDALEDRAVIDVQFILGETTKPKCSEL